ncbi:MAG: hypothetical protein K2N63_16755 [Lachnospiraceae bacterium]|nr:hypothetical protein [Lachnospiraceae bacterium]
MKENGELTREDIIIESDMELADDNENQIVVYAETWFDVERKFGLRTRDEAETWVNLYARYDVAEDSVAMEYVISRQSEEETHDYIPMESEAKMIKGAICEKLEEYCGCTPEKCQR